MNNMNKRPRYNNQLYEPLSCDFDTDGHTSATIDTIIKNEYQHDEIPGTSADTIFTITEIKTEPFDTNLACNPEQAALEGITVKKEPESGNQQEDDDDDDEENDLMTNEHSNQFIANTVTKEEIMIECEPDMEVFEVFKSNSTTTVQNSTKNHQNQKFSKRRKKVLKNWQKDMTFALEKDALELVKNERIWTKYTTNRTDNGSKVIYRCRNVKSRGPQCEAGIYLLYSNTNSTLTLFRSVNRHTCDSIDSKRKQKIKGLRKRAVCDDSLTSSVTGSNSSPIDENQQTLKRRKKVVKNWKKEKVFDLETEALMVVKNEQTWAKYTTNKTDQGNKVIFRCRNAKSRGQQCEAGVYLLYANMVPTVTLFRSINRHTCDSIDSSRKPYIRVKGKSKKKIESEEQSMTNDKNKKMLKRRKKVVKNWQKEKTFELETEALEAVKSEQTWTKYTTNKMDKGNKVIYRCKNVKSKGQQCDAGVYLSYANTDATVTMFRSGNKHTCHTIESKSKSTLSEEAKNIIRTEYEKGLKPKHILGVLIANGFTSTRQVQINNYLAQIRREAYQSETLTLKDFVNTLSEPKTLWAGAECHSTIMTSNMLPNYYS